MSLNTINLAGNKVLVRGTDRFGVQGEQIVDATEWLELNGNDAHSAAHDAFEKAVEDFFAPLTAAVDELNAAHAPEALDPLLFFVTGNKVDAVDAEEQVITELSIDSVILRAIESGNSDRLIWINNELVVTALEPTPVNDIVDEIDDAFGRGSE